MVREELVGRVAEPNLQVALKWSKELPTYRELPNSLSNIRDRAYFIDGVDHLLGEASYYFSSSNQQAKEAYIKRLSSKAKELLPELMPSTNEVVANLVFRLWFGCLAAAKTIALETKSGPNTPEVRRVAFEQVISPLCIEDAIIRAGVGVAKTFKEIRMEKYSLEGVPGNAAACSH
jgi:hypothetical protein